LDLIGDFPPPEVIPMTRRRSALLLLLVPVSIASATGSNAWRPRAVDWSDTVYVPAYSSEAEPPAAVVLHYQRWTSASGQVENVDPAPCGVIFLHEVRLELSLPGGRLLDVATRVGSGARLLGAYDGAIDYAGGSSAALRNADADVVTLVLDDPADVAWFAGRGGVVGLRVVATGEAGFLGPDSLAQETEVRAGVRITVQYLGS